jgi:hypothetical protein
MLVRSTGKGRQRLDLSILNTQITQPPYARIHSHAHAYTHRHAYSRAVFRSVMLTLSSAASSFKLLNLSTSEAAGPQSHDCTSNACSDLQCVCLTYCPT